MSSVAGRLCHCGRDEAGTSFIYIMHPELHGYVFCNYCGLVYAPDGGSEPDQAATEKFKALGRPEFDGQGLVSDPHEWDWLEKSEPIIQLPQVVLSRVPDPAKHSDTVAIVAGVTGTGIVLRWLPSEGYWEDAPELENDYLYGDEGGTYVPISDDEAKRLISDIASLDET